MKDQTSPNIKSTVYYLDCAFYGADNRFMTLLNLSQHTTIDNNTSARRVA